MWSLNDFFFSSLLFRMTGFLQAFSYFAALGGKGLCTDFFSAIREQWYIRDCTNPPLYQNKLLHLETLPGLQLLLSNLNTSWRITSKAKDVATMAICREISHHGDGEDGWSTAAGSPACCLAYGLALALLSLGRAYSRALLLHMKLHPGSEESSWKTAWIRQKTGVTISNYIHTRRDTHTQLRQLRMCNIYRLSANDAALQPLLFPASCKRRLEKEKRIKILNPL